MRNVENGDGPVLEAGQLEHRDDALPVLGGAQQVRGVEGGLAEEVLAAGGLQLRDLPQDDAQRRRRGPAEGPEVLLALGGVEVVEDRPQIRQVQQREALLVREVEDEREDGLLRLVEAQHLRQEQGTEVRHRRPQRYARADPAQGRELDGAAAAGPVLADRVGALGQLGVRLGGGAHAREVALDVGGEDGDARAGQLLCQHLQGHGLAGAGRTRDEPVAVHHAQRQADGSVRDRVRGRQGDAHLDRGLVEGVAGTDRVDGGGGGLGLRCLGRGAHARHSGTSAA